MFQPYGVIRLIFRTHYKMCTYCIVEVRSYFQNAMCLLLVVCSKNLPDDSIGLKHVAV